MSDSPLANELDIAQRLVSDVLAPMKSDFVGKDEVIDLLGVSLVAGENLFLLGPPGTAKTALVNELSRRMHGIAFDYLLTRFTEPNELFGPFDIRRLREGELVTNTEGMLPEADFVFLDELLNANSAILNSLLTVLNERVFRRGRETRKLKTVMVVGASNHLPEDDSLRALFDRFLLRVECNNVPGERLPEVLASGWQLERREWHDGQHVSINDIRRLQKLTMQVDVGQLRPAYTKLVEQLRRVGFSISDRRAVKLQRVVAASALLCGRLVANRTDLWVLRYIWDREEEEEVLKSQVQACVEEANEEEKLHRHPRSEEGLLPDPESMARDVERMAERWKSDGLTDAERAKLRDQLSAVSRQSVWIADESARSHIIGQIDALWVVMDADRS